MPPTAADIAFLDRAIDLAAEAVAQRKGRPYGAVIVRDGVVIAEAFNCIEASGDPTDHAELLAIRAAFATPGTTLAGAVLYASGEPCPMCMGAIYLAGISACFYATTREDAARVGHLTAHIYEQLPLPPAERTIPSIRIASPRATAIMDDWFARQPQR